MRMIHVPVEGDVVEIDVDPESILKDLIEQVKTQEIVNAFGQTFMGPGFYPRVVMLVDEEGLLKNLPHNPRANLFYPHGLIVGDALFVGVTFTHEEGYDWTSLPDDVTLDWWKAEASRYYLLRTGQYM